LAVKEDAEKSKRGPLQSRSSRSPFTASTATMRRYQQVAAVQSLRPVSAAVAVMPLFL
jgi:hypothetical protein